MKKFVVGIFVLFAALNANATLITAEVEYDLSTYVSGGSWVYMGNKTLVAPVTVTDNDRVRIEIGFLPGQALNWNGLGGINPWLGADSVSSFGWSNTTMEFLGLTEGTQWNTAIGSGSSCCGHIGPTNAIYGDGVERTFNGVAIEFDVSYITYPSASKNFSFVGWVSLFAGGTFEAVDDTYIATEPSKIPEPATAALLALGLGLLGRARRQTR